MCGNSSFGLSSVDSVPLTVVANYCNFNSPNDGLCSIHSCNAVSLNPYEGDPKSNFYEASVNHPDCTCRHGDGLWFKKLI
jgi:hypothetical protein